MVYLLKVNSHSKETKMNIMKILAVLAKREMDFFENILIVIMSLLAIVSSWILLEASCAAYYGSGSCFLF